MPAVELLQASVDETDESHFRFLVDGKTIKYVTVAGGLFAADDLCFAPTLLSLLPNFPEGDWNDGYVAQLEGGDKPSFVRTVKRHLPSVTSDWHSTSVDHLDLSFGNKLRSGVYEASSSRFTGSIVAKFAIFEWQIPAVDHECMAYRWIEGKGLGPSFLGLLTEEGRINGFIMENIAGARSATHNDLALCLETLSQLHALGVLHGDINKNNFLIKDDRAILIDFECAQLCEDESAFQEELRRLPDELRDTSGKGGQIVLTQTSTSSEIDT